LIWSAWSQRLMVEAEMRAIIRRWRTARTSSAADQRERGLPRSRGRVQARAVTCARTEEGKKAWPPWPRGLLDGRPRPAPFAPLADRPVRAAHGAGDRGVAPVGMLVSQEENFRPDHFRIWGRPDSRNAPELLVLRSRETNPMPGSRSSAQRDLAAHGAPWADDTRRAFEDLKTRNEFMIRCT
jgi:hypothetical protein